MIPQGPPKGDHMANGRVEMAVREVKRQCRTLRISAEQSTGVRIADDSPLLNDSTEANWLKMENANGAIW